MFQKVGESLMKRINILLLLFLMTKTGLVSAHTGLASSTPSENEVVSQQLEEITLTFNDQIEKISTFKLLKDGKELSLLDIKVVDTQINGFLEHPLDNGFYLIEWKIVGMDGHPLTGTVRFAVEMEEPANLLSSNETGTSLSSTAPETVDIRDEKNLMPMIVLIILGSLALCIVVLIILLRKKRHELPYSLK